MSYKQTLLESFFEKGNDPMVGQHDKTANKKKAAFKIKYQQSYLNYGFIAGDSHSPSPFCITVLSNKAMKPSKLLHHMETKHPTLKDKPLEFVKRKKKKNHEQQKPTTSSSMSTLRVSLLVANCIAKAKKPFTIGFRLILPDAKDIGYEF